MALATAVLSDVQRETLVAVCDTFVPSVSDPAADPVMQRFLARSASELAVAEQIEGLMAQAMTDDQVQGFAGLLDALAEQGFAQLPLAARTQILHGVAASSHDARLGVIALRNSTFLFFYGYADADGQNPNWTALGYPGPISAPPSAADAPKTIRVTAVEGGQADLTADVVVVGSGAGGSVIAASLAQAGRSVLVLELGGYRNEADFKQLEVPGMFELYLGGGMVSSEDGSIAILAGSTLGGGTVVNYMNCLRTPEPVRREWREHGIEGIDEPDYDEHIDAVMARINATDEATTQNRQHRKLIGALDELGMEHRAIVRNVDTTCEDPSVCGYCLAGCQRGAKQSTMKTYLQDASDAGAAVVVNCRADRVLVEDGQRRGSRGERAASRRNGDRSDRPRRDRGGGMRRGRVAGPAAALGHRRSGGGQAPAPASRLDRQRHLRRADRCLGGPDPVRGLRPLRAVARTRGAS